MTAREAALTSSFWPEAGEGIRLPSTLTLAPVLARASSETGAAASSKTHCILPIREPSLTSRKTADFVSRFVRTQPFMVTDRPSGGSSKISLMVKRMAWFSMNRHIG